MKGGEINMATIKMIELEGFMDGSVTKKSITDRIYHIKKMIQCGTLNDYRKGSHTRITE